MTYLPFVRLLATLAIAAAVPAQIYVPPGQTRTGTLGADLFIVADFGQAAAGAAGGADIVILAGTTFGGGWSDTQDHANDDIVEAQNGQVDFIQADEGDLLFVDPDDRVVLYDNTGALVFEGSGSDYYDQYGEPEDGEVEMAEAYYLWLLGTYE
ncbi:MAG: hypothetical protein AB8H80_08150 [Planctomycetota bacterium]